VKENPFSKTPNVTKVTATTTTTTTTTIKRRTTTTASEAKLC